VLVGAGDTAPAGTQVQLAIEHPSSGESLNVDARDAAGRESGRRSRSRSVAPPPEQQEEVRRFIADPER
jgi:hypothetical protein